MPEKKDKPLRLDAIDAARGLAALSVAVYHQGFGTALAKATGWPGGGELIEWLGSTLAVPVFFVISGFCIHLGSLVNPPTAGFIRRFLVLRFFRIYPPWLVAVLLSALSLWLTARPPRAGELLLHLTLTNSLANNYELNPALWSISVECLLYALYPLWLEVRRRHGLPAATGLAFAVSAISGLGTAWIFPEPTGPAFWFFLNVWCGWVAGAVLAEYYHARPDLARLGPAWWLAGAVAWSLHLLGRHFGAYDGIRFYCYLPVTITLCVWPVAGFIQAGGRLAAGPAAVRAIWRSLVQVGVFSYSLYLIHVPLQRLRFPVNDLLTGRAPKLLLFVGWFVLTLGAAWLCHRWVEAPSAKLGRRLAKESGRPGNILPVPQPT